MLNSKEETCSKGMHILLNKLRHRKLQENGKTFQIQKHVTLGANISIGGACKAESKTIKYHKTSEVKCHALQKNCLST
jgi:hypothetical protein